MTVDRIIRSAGLLCAEVDGQILALDPRRGACFALNPVASRIWELLAEPLSLRDIRDRLMEEYLVDEATCEREVGALIDSLKAEALVTAETP